jgi:hypothetical protein
MPRVTPPSPRSGFIEPCLPSSAERPPSGPDWIHEIKHDGYRLMACRDSVGIRLLTRNAHDWSPHYPLVREAYKPAQGPLLPDRRRGRGLRREWVRGVRAASLQARRPPRVLVCLLVCLRPARAERHGLAARADRDAQGDPRQRPARVSAGLAAERAPSVPELLSTNGLHGSFPRGRKC